MSRSPHTLKRRFFFWILGLCTAFGLFAASWVYLTEKKARLERCKKELAAISHRFTGTLEADIRKKVDLGVRVNGVIRRLYEGTGPPPACAPIEKGPDGALRSTDGFSGGFLTNRTRPTPEIRALFARSEKLWKDIAPIVEGVFFNCYLITREGFIRIHPRDWALKIDADHDFNQDLFYSVATPANNPERNPVWTPVYWDSIWKKWMTSLIIPLYRGDEFLGITGGDFILDEVFSRITSMAELESGRQGFVLDGDGHLLVHPQYMEEIRRQRGDPADMNARLNTKDITSPGLGRFIARLHTRGVALDRAHPFRDGMRTILAYPRAIPSLGWTFVVYQDQEELTVDLATLRRQILVASLGLALLLAVTLVFGFHRIILRRLAALTTAALEIGRGNLDHPVPTDPPDEVGLLSLEFSKMRNSVKESIIHLASENLERRRAEENLTITLDSIGDGVIATDTEGRITLMNRVAEALTGWTLEEARGLPLPGVFRIKDQETREDLPDPAGRVLASGEVIKLPRNTILVARDGTIYHISDSGAPIRNDAGETSGAVLVFRDITEQLYMEEQLRQSQKMDSIGKLAGGIAHDFNNILYGILGLSELLEESAENKESRDYARMITETTNRAANLTQKLLDFSRKGKTVSTNLDMHTVVNEALGLLHHSLDKRIVLEKRLRAERTVVNGDPTQLQNMIINLCLNGQDAIEDTGLITLTTRNLELDQDDCDASPFAIEPGAYIELSVEDTGMGMDTETVGRIFEPFYTTKEVGKGTGLGLAAVYGSVKDHMGSITVYSEPGSGTDVHIHLPLADAAQAPAGDAPQPDLIPGEGLILVADDDRTIRSMIGPMLEKLGYRVLLAADGQEALDLFREHREEIDAVILDMIMPRMNGKDAFTRIRTADPEAKVLIASGFTRNVMIDKLIEQGLAGFLSKPFSRIELSHTLHRLLQADEG